ncbi:MAG TPA: hypothetical protein VFL83_00995 [Anaeromyxobacter sp.]|nr:hypothetical protein [Anaeromyxobacter sp.]
MTDRERRIAALAAVFDPARAGALLGRLAAADASAAIAAAAELAGAPRRERLRALAGALAADPPVARVRRAEAVAASERPRIAALLRTLASSDAGATTRAAVVLERLCREAIGR